MDTCECSEEFTEDEAKLIADVKEAIRDEKSPTSSADVCISSRSLPSSFTETVFPIVEGTSTSVASISDIAKGGEIYNIYIYEFEEEFKKFKDYYYIYGINI